MRPAWSSRPDVGIVSSRTKLDVLLEDVGNAETVRRGVQAGVMKTMQLQDGEVMIRRGLHHIQKWIDAPSVRIALS
jgi:hypothetical protein